MNYVFTVKALSPLQLRRREQELDEVLIQDNEAFYDAYCAEEMAIMGERMQNFLSSTEFDPNYDGGLFFTEAVKRKDISFLQRLVTDNQDSKVCAENLFKGLKVAARKEDGDMIMALANLGANLEKIKDYDVYYHSDKVQFLIDRLLTPPEDTLTASGNALVEPSQFV